jgi:hypothetical protein
MRWRVGVLCLAAVLAVGVVLVLALPREEARAGAATDFAQSDNADLVKYVQGGAALNRRLVALEVLRKKAGSTADLVDIAGGKNAVLAVYAAGALGKQKTSDSKAALKDLVTNTKLGAEVRKAAVSLAEIRTGIGAEIGGGIAFSQPATRVAEGSARCRIRSTRDR